MNEAKLRGLVDQAVVLDREIREKTNLLKEIKKQLVTEGRSRPDEQGPTPGGGRSWLAEGHDGCLARVTFPADSLKDRIDPESKEGAKAIQKAGKFKERLFLPAIVYKPAENFRALAEELLGRRDGVRLVNMCESDSAARVSFETKGAAALAPGEKKAA